MNDFTKEELKDIQCVLRLWVLKDTESSIKEISNKIQSMIDNYCEHDYRSMGNHPWLHCIKCKGNFNYESQNKMDTGI